MKKLLKSSFRKLTRRLRVRIQSGPCAGLLWSLPTRMNFIRGVYEPNLAQFISATLKPVDIFWDVGAHFGYYTLLASKIVAAGNCHSFEPNPDNRWYLEHHIQWNHLPGMNVFPCAVAAADGSRNFGAVGTGAGKLDSGKLIVSTRSIDSLIKSGTCRAPSFMKIDVEGAEVEVLNGELEHGPDSLVCVATHGFNLHAECRNILNRHGYQVHDLPEKGLLIGTGANRSVSRSALELLAAKTQPA